MKVMGRPTVELYTRKQWLWLAERYNEGYSLHALAEWAGVADKTLKIKLNDAGAVLRQKEERHNYGQRGLDERKKEFNSMWNEVDK